MTATIETLPNLCDDYDFRVAIQATPPYETGGFLHGTWHEVAALHLLDYLGQLEHRPPTEEAERRFICYNTHAEEVAAFLTETPETPRVMVIAYKNKNSGNVHSAAGALLPIMQSLGSITLLAEIGVDVDQRALQHPNTTEVEPTLAISQWPAIGQAREKLLARYPNIRFVERDDTVGSALEVAENDGMIPDPENPNVLVPTIAIASEIAGRALGLIPSEESVSKPGNVTRFFVFHRGEVAPLGAPNRGACMVTVPNHKGGLYHALLPFKTANITLKDISYRFSDDVHHSGELTFYLKAALESEADITAYNAIVHNLGATKGYAVNDLGTFVDITKESVSDAESNASAEVATDLQTYWERRSETEEYEQNSIMLHVATAERPGMLADVLEALDRHDVDLTAMSDLQVYIDSHAGFHFLAAPNTNLDVVRSELQALGYIVNHGEFIVDTDKTTVSAA